MLEEHKAVILQKYARAWLARRRFQSIRRFVLNIQLTYRVQRLQKKLEDQVLVFIMYLSYVVFLTDLFCPGLITQLMLLKFMPILGVSNSFMNHLCYKTEVHCKGLLRVVV